ncbi:hypothetical protein [Streptomyces sp. DG1A-41]|uniref:hypothetical protein n=1 Tax=Streptomyces sp. DG1A-41 TaxID=3125779 RepID=UPI0030D0CDDB
MGGDASVVRERLRELSGPELYRRNAFRVTGASTCAARRTIVRRRQQIATAAKAGVAVGPSGELPLPGAAGPEELRAAFDVLDHPQRRIVDELFWFWDAPDASCPCEPELHRQHDEAVRAHARALDAELGGGEAPRRRAAGGPKRPAGKKKGRGGPRRDTGRPEDGYWQTAARLWRMLLGQRAVWAHLRHRVVALDDKRLTETAVTVLEAEVRRVLVSAVAGLAARTQDPARLARSCTQWTWTGRGVLGEALEEQLTPLYESAESELRETGRNSPAPSRNATGRRPRPPRPGHCAPGSSRSWSGSPPSPASGCRWAWANSPIPPPCCSTTARWPCPPPRTRPRPSGRASTCWTWRCG